MDAFVTIKTFVFLTQLGVVRAKLESENIECFVPDENLVSVHPFYSNAIGGIRLQVRQKDVQRANEILNEAGLTPDLDPPPSKIYSQLEGITGKIPLVNKLALEKRLFVLAALIVSLIVIVIYVISRPSTYDILTMNTWCVDKIVYNGKSYKPYSNDYLKLTGEGICDEGISFWTNGNLYLPGINSRSLRANWDLENKQLRISNADTLDYIYNGSYTVKFDDDEMVLISGTSVIHCYSYYSRTKY